MKHVNGDGSNLVAWWSELRFNSLIMWKSILDAQRNRRRMLYPRAALRVVEVCLVPADDASEYHFVQ